MSDAPSVQELTSVHLVQTLDDALDKLGDITEDEEVKYNAVIGATLDAVQDKFYLVPKTKVQEDGSLAGREAPSDSVTDLLSNLYLNVSN